MQRNPDHNNRSDHTLNVGWHSGGSTSPKYQNVHPCHLTCERRVKENMFVEVFQYDDLGFCPIFFH